MKEEARAKVNLFLHVLGRRADGWHELESLAAFAAGGDSVEANPSAELSLTIEGPFSAILRRAEADGDPNLVIRAAEAVGAEAAFRLTKRLPIASGLGGGSADAAAALRLAARLDGRAYDEPDYVSAAAAIGADVPVCLHSRAAWMTGRGDQVDPEPRFTPLPALLVNPAVAVRTPEVFAALGLAPGASGPSQALDKSDREAAASDLLRFLARTRNDLEPAAISVEPAIGEALALVRSLAGLRLARMSGSGASVFGLFETEPAAKAAAGRLKDARPDWWCMATLLS